MVSFDVEIERACRHAPEFLDHDFGIRHRFSLDRARHHRGGSLAYRAALPFEGDGLDLVLQHVHRQLDVIPTQRVVPLGMPVRTRYRTEVPWLAVVIEYHFLIKLPHVGHENISCTFRMPSTSLSISSLVL